MRIANNYHIAKIENVEFPDIGTPVITFTNPETETSDTLLNSNEFAAYLKNYKSWSFIALGPEPSDGVELYQTFYDVWNSFFLNRFSNYQKVYAAIMKNYDPLYNYDKTSEINTTTGKQTDKNIMAQVTDKTKNPLIQSSATDKIAPYDDTYSDRSKTESRVEAHDITFERGGHTDEFEKGERKDVVHDHTYGNVGVTTSMTLLTEEKNGRRFNFLKDIIADFVNECLFMVDIV